MVCVLAGGVEKFYDGVAKHISAAVPVHLVHRDGAMAVQSGGRLKKM